MLTGSTKQSPRPIRRSWRGRREEDPHPAWSPDLRRPQPKALRAQKGRQRHSKDLGSSPPPLHLLPILTGLPEQVHIRMESGRGGGPCGGGPSSDPSQPTAQISPPSSGHHKGPSLGCAPGYQWYLQQHKTDSTLPSTTNTHQEMRSWCGNIYKQAQDLEVPGPAPCRGIRQMPRVEKTMSVAGKTQHTPATMTLRGLTQDTGRAWRVLSHTKPSTCMRTSSPTV